MSLALPMLHDRGRVNIVEPGRLNAAVSFARASTATYIGSNGLLQTAAVNQPRYEYDTSGNYLGLLIEEARTNVLLNSATLATQSVTVTAAAQTLSFYGTGTITLSGSFSGSLVGTGTSNRVILTFTPTAGTLTVTVAGSCTSAQLEAGASATSYIFTTSAAVTRSADVCYSNSLAMRINNSEGVLIAEWYDKTAPIMAQRLIVQIDQGVSNFNGAVGIFEQSSIIYSAAYASAAAQASFPLVNQSTGAHKAIIAYQANNFASAADSSALGTDTAGLAPVGMTTVNIGSRYSGTNSYANCNIKRITYIPRRLLNSELQRLIA